MRCKSFQKTSVKTESHSTITLNTLQLGIYRVINHLIYGTIMYDKHNECSTLRESLNAGQGTRPGNAIDRAARICRQERMAGGGRVCGPWCVRLQRFPATTRRHVAPRQSPQTGRDRRLETRSLWPQSPSSCGHAGRIEGGRMRLR